MLVGRTVANRTRAITNSSVTPLSCTTLCPQCVQGQGAVAPRPRGVLLAHRTFCTAAPNVLQATRRAALARLLERKRGRGLVGHGRGQVSLQGHGLDRVGDQIVESLGD